MSSLDRDRWRQVSPCLDRALELAPHELAAWLGALRAEQPALAADLEALLAARDALTCERFLEDAPHWNAAWLGRSVQGGRR